MQHPYIEFAESEKIDYEKIFWNISDLRISDYFFEKLVRVNYQESYEKICKLPAGLTMISEIIWKSFQD